jgi:hypothetical protein
LYNSTKYFGGSYLFGFTKFITDIYHTYLNGYKPPKTARICLHLVPDSQKVFKPSYWGSILTCYALFDEGSFASKTGGGQ